MILFAAYAIIVWYLAARYRRDWRGFLAPLIGAALALLAVRIPALQRVLPERWWVMGFGTELQILIWAESMIVLVVGLFIALMPRPPARPHCAYCWYEIAGLDPEQRCCPECGMPPDGYANRKSPRRARPGQASEHPAGPIAAVPAPAAPPLLGPAIVGANAPARAGDRAAAAINPAQTINPAESATAPPAAARPPEAPR